MKLHIENVAKIKKADIDVEGITVIAGSNNTGKSTVGKALFAMFESFYSLEKFVEDWKPNDAKKILKSMGIIWILYVKGWQMLKEEKLLWLKMCSVLICGRLLNVRMKTKSGR